MTTEVLGLDLDRPPPRLARRLAYVILAAGAAWTAFVEVTFLQRPLEDASVLLFLVVVPYAPYAAMAALARKLGSSPARRARSAVLLGAALVAGSSAVTLHVAFAAGASPGSGLAFVVAPPAQVGLALLAGGAALAYHRRHVARADA